MGPNTGKLANCQPSANNAFGSIRNFSQTENCSTHLHECCYLDIFCRKASVQEFSHWRRGHQNSFITEARRWREVMVIWVIVEFRNRHQDSHRGNDYGRNVNNFLSTGKSWQVPRMSLLPSIQNIPRIAKENHQNNSTTRYRSCWSND